MYDRVGGNLWFIKYLQLNIVKKFKHSNSIPNEHIGHCNEIAKQLPVIPDIHNQDFIYHFLINNPVVPTKKGAISYYFNDGSNSAMKLSKLLYDKLGYKRIPGLKILEFASGYGCVTRHLVNHLPGEQITSCDIHSEAMNFIKSSLSTEVMLSRPFPEELIFDKKKYGWIFDFHNTWHKEHEIYRLPRNPIGWLLV